jgi:hypothetical protein
MQYVLLKPASPIAAPPVDGCIRMPDAHAIHIRPRPGWCRAREPERSQVLPVRLLRRRPANRRRSSRAEASPERRALGLADWSVEGCALRLAATSTARDNGALERE